MRTGGNREHFMFYLVNVLVLIKTVHAIHVRLPRQLVSHLEARMEALCSNFTVASLENRLYEKCLSQGVFYKF